MATSGISGLLLTPGAGAGRDQPALVAVDAAVTDRGLAVERIEFPGRSAGRRRPDSAEVCIDSVRTATSGLAGRLGVPTSAIAVGGRSMGGRMCSMAAAEGLGVAALVLISYPLHPAQKPERLRTGHFPALCPVCSSAGVGTPWVRPTSSNGRPRPSRDRSRWSSWRVTIPSEVVTLRLPTSWPAGSPTPRERTGVGDDGSGHPHALWPYDG
jgi:hypothetical protein